MCSNDRQSWSNSRDDLLSCACWVEFCSAYQYMLCICLGRLVPWRGIKRMPTYETWPSRRVAIHQQPQRDDTIILNVEIRNRTVISVSKLVTYQWTYDIHEHTSPLIEITPFSVFVALLTSIILPDPGSLNPIGEYENVSTTRCIQPNINGWMMC